MSPRVGGRPQGDPTFCAIARFARSALGASYPGVPLRFTPGFMLPPATRVLQSLSALHSVPLWEEIS
jgi:hypothetical protein